MQPLTHQLNARRLVRDDHHALLLDDAAPPQPVRLALVVQGSERLVFPALALDDWGRERSGLALYHWLYEEGPRFPRAELFGFDFEGVQTQIFLRDLELSFRYPCFVYLHGEDPVEDGQRVGTIFVPGELQQNELRKIEPPEGLPWALRRAAVRWRQAHPQTLREAGWHAPDSLHNS